MARQQEVRRVETIETIVARVREIRAERESADARMMLYLVSIEDGPLMETLRASGCSTIDDFIASYGLCYPARYRNFREGLRRLGVSDQKAIELGAEAVVAAAKLTPEPEKVEKYVAATEAWIEAHGGVHPSDQTSSSHVKSVDPQERTPRDLQRQATLRQQAARLQAELVNERTQRRALERRVRELEAENQKLHRALERGKRTAKPVTGSRAEA